MNNKVALVETFKEFKVHWKFLKFAIVATLTLTVMIVPLIFIAQYIDNGLLRILFILLYFILMLFIITFLSKRFQRKPKEGPDE